MTWQLLDHGCIECTELPILTATHPKLIICVLAAAIEEVEEVFAEDYDDPSASAPAASHASETAQNPEVRYFD